MWLRLPIDPRLAARLTLLALCLLAFGLRLHGLDSLVLSDDEATSIARYVQSSPLNIIADPHPNNHWLTSLLGHSMGYWGQHHFWLRWPAVWFGTLAIPLLAVAGRRLFRSRWEGVIAAGLLTLSAFQWQWAQQFRGYSLLLCLALLSVLLLQQALKTGRWRYWAALLGGMILTAASHLFGTLMVMVIVVWLGGWSLGQLGRRRRFSARQRSALLIAGLGLALTGGLLWFGQTQIIRRYHALPDVPFWQLIHYQWLALQPTLPDVAHFLSGLAIAFTTQRQPIWALLIFWGVIGGGMLASRPLSPGTRSLLITWLLLPMSAVILAEFIIPGFFVFDRFLIFLLPAWLLLLTRGLVGGSRWLSGYLSRPRGFSSVAFLILMLMGLGYFSWANLSLIGAYYAYQTKNNWRGVATHLQQEAQPGDVILCHHLPHRFPPPPLSQDPCLRDVGHRLRKLEVRLHRLDTLIEQSEAGHQHQAATGAVWLIVWGEAVPALMPPLESPPHYAARSLAIWSRFDPSPPLIFDGLERVALLKAETAPTLIANADHTLDYLIRLDETSPARFDYHLHLAHLLAYQERYLEAHAALNAARAVAPAHQADRLTQTARLISALTPSTGEPLRSLDVAFGQPPRLRLTGQSVPARLQPGQTVPLTLRWHVLSPLAADYTIFLHLRNAEGQTIAQLDFRPFDDAYPTSQWPSGAMIAEQRFWSLPNDLPPGRYALYGGLYRVETMTRLPLAGDNRNDSAFFGAVWVE